MHATLAAAGLVFVALSCFLASYETIMHDELTGDEMMGIFLMAGGAAALGIFLLGFAK